MAPAVLEVIPELSERRELSRLVDGDLVDHARS